MTALKILAGFLLVPVIIAGLVLISLALLGAMVWKLLTGDDCPIEALDRLLKRLEF